MDITQLRCIGYISLYYFKLDYVTDIALHRVVKLRNYTNYECIFSYFV